MSKIKRYNKNYNPLIADEVTPLTVLFHEQFLEFIVPVGNKVKVIHYKVWNALTGELKKIMPQVTNFEITSFRMDHNQKRFAIGDNTGEVKIYNYIIGIVMKTLTPHTGEIVSIIFCDSLKRIVTGSNDCVIYIHDDKDLYSSLLLRKITE